MNQTFTMNQFLLGTNAQAGYAALAQQEMAAFVGSHGGNAGAEHYGFGFDGAQQFAWASTDTLGSHANIGMDWFGVSASDHFSEGRNASTHG